MHDLTLRYVFAFVATQIIEVPIYVRGPLRTLTLSAKRAIGYAFVASLLTHPIAALALPWLVAHFVARPVFVPGHTVVDGCFVARVLVHGLVSEGFAVVVEGLYLKRLGARRPFAWSLVANGASVTVGACLTLTTGFP